MNSSAPDSTEVLSDLISRWDDYIGSQWHDGDIYSLDLVRALRAAGRTASRSTVGKWLRELAERGEYVEVQNVIHPVNKRRCTVYRPVRAPAALPALPAAAGTDDTNVRRGPGVGVLKSGMSKGRKGTKAR